MVPPDSRRVSRVRRYSGYGLAFRAFGYRAVTFYGGPSQTLYLAVHVHYAVPQPRRPGGQRFGLVRVRSPLLAESRLISLPLGTEMFHFPRFPPDTYAFSVG